MVIRGTNERCRWSPAVPSRELYRPGDVMSHYRGIQAQVDAAGECFTLEWPALNFDAGMVSIVRSLEDRAGHLPTKPPKRSTRKRSIRLSPHMLVVIRQHRAQVAAQGLADAPIFQDTKGNCLRNGNVTKRSFKPLLSKAGLPDRRLYDLPDTCATLLRLAKVPAKIVGERLGHASVTITLGK